MKYKFEKGDFIGDSFLQYVCEDKRKSSNRYVMTFCSICGAFSSKRLYDILSGRIKSCGCYYRELVKDGKLHIYSLNARKGNPFLQKGGKRYKEGLCIYLRKDIIDAMEDIETVVREIVDFVKRYGEAGEIPRQ